jgi:hypothetical protein
VIETELFTLLSDSSITAYTSTRIYPNDPVENTAWPFIVYNCRACECVFSFAGPSGVSTLEVEVVLEANSVAQQEALSSAVKAKLNGHSTAPIQGMFLVDESADKLGDEQEGIIYQETQTYRVVANL